MQQENKYGDMSYDEDLNKETKYKQLKKRYFIVFKEFDALSGEYKLLRKRYRNVLDENRYLKEKLKSLLLNKDQDQESK